MSFSNEIIKLLDDLGKRFGIAIDWTSKNIMPYIEDLFRRIWKYEITMDVVTIVINSLIVIFGIVYLIILLKSRNKCLETETDQVLWTIYYGGADMTVIGIVCSILIAPFFLASIITLWCIIPELIKYICIPESIILEYIQNLSSLTN